MLVSLVVSTDCISVCSRLAVDVLFEVQRTDNQLSAISRSTLRPVIRGDRMRREREAGCYLLPMKAGTPPAFRNKKRDRVFWEVEQRRSSVFGSSVMKLKEDSFNSIVLGLCADVAQ